MFRVDTSTAVTSLPAQDAAGTPGFFTKGNAAAGLAATVPGQDWFNIIQEELMAIVLAAGLTPAKATTNQVLTAIQSLINSNNQVLIVVDEKASGTGGGTFTQGAWRTRDLNTVRANSIDGASLSSNQVTLPAGTYQIVAYMPAYTVWQHKGRLRNITDSADTIIGSSEACHAGGLTSTASILMGQFTITAQKTFELQHYCAVTATDVGFGGPSGIASMVEVYTQAVLKKIV